MVQKCIMDEEFGPLLSPRCATQSLLERSTIEGDSPVEEVQKDLSVFQSSVYWRLGVNVGGINFQP